MRKFKLCEECEEEAKQQGMKIFDPTNRDLFVGDVTPESVRDLITAIDSINKYEEEIFQKEVSLLNKITAKRNIPFPEDLVVTGGNIEPIILNINSFGGSVYDCFSLVSVIKNSKVPIVAKVQYAMSCGALIASVCSHRIGYELTTIMIHNLSTMLWGQLQSIKENVAQSDVLEKNIIKILLENSKIEEDKLKKVFETKSDWYINADEALELGLIDEIYERYEEETEEE